VRTSNPTLFSSLSKNVNIKIYKTIILYVVLYRCETEQHRFSVFEKREVRIIFKPEMDKLAESWRKLHNEDPSTICILYQIAYYYDDQMSEQCKLVCMWEMKYAYNILVGKPGRTQPIGRPTSRCEAKVKIDLKKKVVRV
jgi:hypothetical protein